MEKNQFTLSLALVDALPVLFFGAAAAMLGVKLQSAVFIVGAALCLLAGAGKVAWKLLLALRGKDVAILGAQLRYVMPVGFLLMILIPVTNMGHLIMKYWMYHDIRWGDSPTAQDQKNQQKIPGILQYKTTWAAQHITGDGQARTWLEVATTNPAAPKKD